MRQKELLAITQDGRLTPEAFRLVMYVAALGSGEHPIPALTFSVLLNHANEKKVRKTLRLAIAAGYLSRSPGGRGRHDRWAFSPEGIDHPNGHLSPDKIDHPKSDPESLSPEQFDHPKEVGKDPDSEEISLRADRFDHPKSERSHLGRTDSTTLSDLARTKSTTLTDSPDKNDHPKFHGPYIRNHLEEVVVDSAGAREEGRSENRISPQALDAINEHSDTLEGCRGALRDYLAEHVSGEPQQRSYVMAVVCWLRDSDPTLWRKPDGENIPVSERPAVLAEALNDLGASNEAHMKRPVGEPGNLRTKIDILVQGRARRERRHTEGRPKPEAPPRPSSPNPSHKFIIESGA